MNESTASMGMMILWMVVIFGVMYFLMIRPQKKEQKRLQAMLNSMEVGDSIVTTGGFYGVIIDMTEEDVIVEFGNPTELPYPNEKTGYCRSGEGRAGIRITANKKVSAASDVICTQNSGHIFIS